MNANTLIITLKSISSDSNKNSTLNSIIHCLNDIDWQQVGKIIHCYSSDSYKVEALGVICSNNKMNEILCKILLSNIIVYIVRLISSDSYKCAAIKILSKYTNGENGRILVDVISAISSDSYKIEAIKNLANVCVDQSHLSLIIDEISSDSYKSSAISYLINRINNISESNLIKIIKNISSDSYKIQVIGFFQNKIDCNYNIMLNVTRNISSDSYKLQALNFFTNKGLTITYNELLELLNTFSSNSAKCNCLLSFKTFKGEILDQENFCKTLAKEINDEKLYLQSAKHLSLNQEYVEIYKPKKTVTDFNFDEDDEFDNLEGIVCVSSIARDGKITTTKTYSNGSVIKIIRTLN